MILPNKWQIIPLEELAEVRSGVTLSQKVILDGVELPYLRVANVQDGKIDLTEIKNVTVEKNKVERFLLKKGDILLTEGGDFDKLGRGAVWQGEIEPCLHQNHVFAVRIKGKLLPEFFAALTRTHHGRTYFLSCAKRSTNLASINSSQLKRFPVILPPLAEQKKIAEILSTWDEAISVVDRQLENCRQQKKALMQKLLTGKKRLPGFSGEWRERKISEIASVNPENLANLTRNDYRFNYISLDDVTRGNLTGFTQQTFASAPSRARRIIQQGDVLVAMVRPNLKSHLLIRDKVEDFICSTGFCVVRPREGVLSQYIYHQFFGDIVNAQIEGLITGSNYPAINSYDVENILIPLPGDIQEQKAIANVLDGYESSLKKLEEKRNLLVLEKKSLMQQLLTGKKRAAV